MSDDDLTQRAEDYERRLAAAGSTEDIVGGLVKGAERSRKVVRWLAISLVLDVVLSLALAALALVAWQQADTVRAESRASCVQSAKNTVAINEFLDLLITNTGISTVLTPAEKASRIKGYRALINKIPDCYTPGPQSAPVILDPPYWGGGSLRLTGGGSLGIGHKGQHRF